MNRNAAIANTRIQWHPAFYAAAELEFLSNRAELEFCREYNLGKKPLQIDLLVIEKLDDVSIENEIGHIFKRHNIIEYKSPGDDMTIDDFFKTVGYACIYKGLGEKVDQIPVDQLTVSLFREGYPEELFRSLNHYGLTVEKRSDGIYYIQGLLIPTQIIVMKELDGRRHRSLKMLSRNVSERDIREFVEAVQTLNGQGERENVEAVLQVSVSANYKLYGEMKRRYSGMCEALRRLMWDEIEEGVREGRKEGELMAKRDMSLSLARMGIPVEKIAEAAQVSMNLVQEWLSGNADLAK